jgi:hypothetical protein
MAEQLTPEQVAEYRKMKRFFRNMYEALVVPDCVDDAQDYLITLQEAASDWGQPDGTEDDEEDAEDEEEE